MTLQVDTGQSPDALVATDVVGGEHHQLIKLEVGGPGAAAPVHGGNPLPVATAKITDTASWAGVAGADGAAEVVPADPNRKVVAIFNDGAEKVYLALGETAQVGRGIPLAAGAGVILEGYTEALHAIRAGAADVALCGYTG